jgi:hypothetical protein
MQGLKVRNFRFFKSSFLQGMEVKYSILKGNNFLKNPTLPGKSETPFPSFAFKMKNACFSPSVRHSFIVSLLCLGLPPRGLAHSFLRT